MQFSWYFFPPLISLFLCLLLAQEFEIVMAKQQGSLGFTLRKEDESILGHYVRALLRPPATTDGRIKPGDKILAVSCSIILFLSRFLFFRSRSFTLHESLHSFCFCSLVYARWKIFFATMVLLSEFKLGVLWCLCVCIEFGAHQCFARNCFTLMWLCVVAVRSVMMNSKSFVYHQ